MDSVKIPQNVYIEDRIVGPLTLRQTLMIAVGGGFSYLLFAMLQKTYGRLSIPVMIVVWMPAALSALFALVKVNDLSLTRICLLLIEKMTKSSVRTWAPRQGISINVRIGPPSTTQNTSAKTESENDSTRTQIRELSSLVDNTHAPTTMEEKTVATPVRADTHTEEVPVQVTSAITVEEDASSLPRLPVDPSRIKTDDPLHSPSLPTDLSVFRDIFPSKEWH